jgi:nucleoside-diphosphate-sugar epimerase
MQSIRDTEELDDLLSEPLPDTVEAMGSLEGDLLVLGAGGKMGPSLARMARRASDAAAVRRRVIAVSRFSEPGAHAALHRGGVETIACDLMDQDALRSLPDAPNVMYMAGMKFGTTGGEPATWALNAFLPGLVCARFRGSRIVAFSSGNVYGFTAPGSGGSVETDPPDPRGEYAWSVLGRERLLQHFSSRDSTPALLLRLNYACELRYGVLVDIARHVHEGLPVSLAMGSFNVIWQRDAVSMALRCFPLAWCPAVVLNLTGPEILGVRDTATRFGELLGKAVAFSGNESGDALLSNASRAFDLLGRPRTGASEMIATVSDWVSRGGASLGKATHFESRDGRF